MALQPRTWFYTSSQGNTTCTILSAVIDESGGKTLPFHPKDCERINQSSAADNEGNVYIHEPPFQCGDYYLHLPTLTLKHRDGSVSWPVQCHQFTYSNKTYIWSWVSNRSGKVHAFDSVANERLELEYRCAVANQRWNTTDELGVFFTHGGCYTDIKRQTMCMARSGTTATLQRDPQLAQLTITLPPPPPMSDIPQILESSVSTSVVTTTTHSDPTYRESRKKSPSSHTRSASPHYRPSHQTVVPLANTELPRSLRGNTNVVAAPDVPLLTSTGPVLSSASPKMRRDKAPVVIPLSAPPEVPPPVPPPVPPTPMPPVAPPFVPYTVPSDYTTPSQVVRPPTLDDVSPEYKKMMECSKVTEWVNYTPKKEDVCVICLCEYDSSSKPVQLPCSHHYCTDCILRCYKGFLKCPVCGKIYGVRTGNQPNGMPLRKSSTTNANQPGTMKVSHTSSHCDGFPQCGTIVIEYRFSSGIQGKDHPSPGERYSGTSRTAYLPDNKEGNEIAWDRRLIFRIGTSTTTGLNNQIVWNGIHHKTRKFGGASQHGYPDETYFVRVKEELKDQGVTQK